MLSDVSEESITSNLRVENYPSKKPDPGDGGDNLLRNIVSDMD
jgi:hypothetical protein